MDVLTPWWAYISQGCVVTLQMVNEVGELSLAAS